MRINFDKIIRYELILLFMLVILSFVAFYFSDSLPDNALGISSSTESISFFVYYTTSIISFVGYFTGPWIIVPFIIQTLLYAFLYSKRVYKWDSLNIFPLTYLCLLGFFYMSPEILGKGLQFLIDKKVEPAIIAGSALFAFALFLGGTFRSSFKEVMMSGWNRIVHFCNNIVDTFLSFSPGLFLNQLGTKLKNLKASFFFLIQRKLKGESKNKLVIDDQTLRSVEEQAGDNGYNGYNEYYDEYGEEGFEHFPEDPDAPLAPSNKENVEILEGAAAKEEGTATQEENMPTFNKPKVKTRKIFSQNPSKETLQNEKQYYNLVDNMKKPKRSSQLNTGPNEKYFNDIIDRIEEKLQEFRIDGQIIRVLKGPVVDTFELELGSGVKVSKVTTAEADLSLALYGAPIRIVYPMIGRTTVGIEVPRKPRDVIFLDEVLSSDEFNKTKSSLPVAMGKDAFGETYIVDLAKMPHMLIAGATGAGKSVFINTLLVSLLVKKSPRQMQLILIDPKQLELALYSNLPHLVVPVITDPKTAAISLMWAVQEMERRYSILKDAGVRNLDSFNEKIKKAPPELFSKIHQYYENADQEGYELPYLVIIIDEFADLILTKAGKEIENNVCRLAAKARAAGIHLVVATQRPSVDVITGLIKSNFPTRVSFRVTSATDSRTILNTMGAEKLLGNGDMLYKHGTTNCRLHSAFVNEEEVELFTDSLQAIKPVFNEGAMEFIENGGEQVDDPYAFGSHIQSVSGNQSKKDEKYDEAVRIVIEHRSASASMLQRKLGVGYNRASNLIDELESNGIIGPAQGSKPRKVLTAQDVY